MPRPRFSVAQLMAVVLYLGFGFAALRNANSTWSSATFGLAIVAISVAFVGACARKDESRWFWAGFATAGGVRLVIWLQTTQFVGSQNGPPRPLFYGLQHYINPTASGGAPWIYYMQICNSIDVLLLGLVGAAFGRLLAVKADRSNPGSPR